MDLKKGCVFMGLQETMRALADPTRREILELVRDRPLPAGEIAAITGLSPGNVAVKLTRIRCKLRKMYNR